MRSGRSISTPVPQILVRGTAQELIGPVTAWNAIGCASSSFMRIRLSTDMWSASGSPSWLSTATAFASYTRALRQLGLNPSGSARPRSCSWPIESISTGQTGRDSRRIQARLRSSRPSVTRRSYDCIGVGSPAHVNTRLVALHEINQAICELRERSGLPAIRRAAQRTAARISDDPQHHEPVSCTSGEASSERSE